MIHGKKIPTVVLKLEFILNYQLFLLFFYNLQHTPNNISLIYCASGIITGLFLASNNFTLMIVGLAIFVLKGAIDWTDGLIARMKNQISSVGHILDTWGSYRNN